MFGEAFAAEISPPQQGEEEEPTKDDVFVPLKTLGPKWTVGGGEDDFDGGEGKESEEDSIFSKYVFGAVKGTCLLFH